ncbi:agmatine deiminase family protein [uncultured Paludibaculum sp.]|uniref:agmatine deiminase family protein n=1 Tax=uncultured Paludibaculum sp. TaxID=1765020 RepID=UPI002AAB5F49|nr:agmatine deiminase family protein [uncultured Paludibaculum sp.]
MPSEWAPHEATWLGWPHETTDWPGKFTPIPFLYGEIVRILSRREQVRILIPPKHVKRARSVLEKCGAWNGNVLFVEAETNRSWTRDYCPLSVKGPGGEKIATKWRFNGWAKYPNWKNDDAAGEKAARASKAKIVKPEWNGRRVVLEGGSIDVNGAGLMLTTEECLLSDIQARNPGLEREQLEALFHGYLGIEKVLWLRRGIAGDDTHGHVDDLARFTDERTVAIAVEEDREEENYEPLAENVRLLRRMKGLDGNALRVVELPMPRPVFFDGQRLPASYANFYIANGVVLVPVFQDPNDRVALNILARLFPTRDVIGLYCVDLVLGLGTIHCGTMQDPA